MTGTSQGRKEQAQVCLNGDPVVEGPCLTNQVTSV